MGVMTQIAFVFIREIHSSIKSIQRNLNLLITKFLPKYFGLKVAGDSGNDTVQFRVKILSKIYALNFNCI